MAERLLIRADAGPSIGTGHLIRMLALAEAWEVSTGERARLLSNCPDRLAERALRSGLDVSRSECAQGSRQDAEVTVTEAKRSGAHLVVCDGYSFAESFQRAVVATGAKLLVVDDNGENGSYAADWVLNLNVHASADMYRQRAAHTTLLLGTQYTLVRRLFREQPARPSSRAGRPLRCLVTLGGADPVDATGAVLRAFADAGSSAGLELRVLVGAANPRLAEYEASIRLSSMDVRLDFDVDDPSEAFRWADVAIAAAGGTVWELALTGVPCLLLALADNQVGLAKQLDAIGAAEYLGDARVERPGSAWLQRAAALGADLARGQRLTSKASELVDGHGAERVVQVLRGR